MHIDIITLFPGMFSSYLNESILQRAQRAGRLSVALVDIRDYASGNHRVTDEPPYGGGGGMVLKPEPLFEAVEATVAAGERRGSTTQPHRILLTPQGRPLDQTVVERLATRPWLILLCGRYEGVDERVREHLVDEELSIGDYVLTGGELAAMVVVDAVTRTLPGVLGDENAASSDSYATGLLEGPHYTRPTEFRGWAVPDVLRSGHAARIGRWRREGALRRTWQRRPELLLTANLDEADRQFLLTLANESREAENDR